MENSTGSTRGISICTNKNILYSLNSEESDIILGINDLKHIQLNKLLKQKLKAQVPAGSDKFTCDTWYSGPFENENVMKPVDCSLSSVHWKK